MFRSLIKNTLPISCLALTILFSISNLAAQNDNASAWVAFEKNFEIANVGNLHLFAPTKTQNDPDFTFYGTPVERGLYRLFSANWRDELPSDFKTYALYKIRYGATDAYLLRFHGPGTQNMIGLFTKKKDQLVFVRNLANYYCSESMCWQMDSWLQDFDGDTRLDILQKARVVQFTLMGAPVDEYTQVLRQNEDGTFSPTEQFSIALKNYLFKTNEQ
ncbi:hypothetical protein [Lewinella cohaerens]|uniref:hypothetical protein n=1 Tax=Lewinella cohaerens TaxID=70995 RepID=UPI00035F2A70|nr:hypothetical protein [Lewinella cohaerens]